MDRKHDLEIILRSRTPIIVIETRDESRVLRMLMSLNLRTSTAESRDGVLSIVLPKTEQAKTKRIEVKT